MNRRLLVAAVCLGLAASPALAAKPKGFTPGKLAGTWSGNWSNHTFNTTGTITLQEKPVRKGKALQFIVDLGGNALGCPDPAPERTPTITKGKGQNHWNKRGFTLRLNSPAYGAFKVTYSQKTHKLTGGGGNPPCAPGVTWQLDGTLTHASFNGTVSIKLANGQSASSSITATRQ
jgi:hypothetical protein